jgi:hypothetical protein
VTFYLYKGEIKGEEIVMTREKLGADQPDPIPLILQRAK